MKKFLRMRAIVRWKVGMDKVKVRLRRHLVGRWLATVLSQLLLVSLQLELLQLGVLFPSFLAFSQRWIESA